MSIRSEWVAENLLLEVYMAVYLEQTSAFEANS